MFGLSVNRFTRFTEERRTKTTNGDRGTPGDTDNRYFMVRVGEEVLGFEIRGFFQFWDPVTVKTASRSVTG